MYCVVLSKATAISYQYLNKNKYLIDLVSVDPCCKSLSHACLKQSILYSDLAYSSIISYNFFEDVFSIWISIETLSLIHATIYYC